MKNIKIVIGLICLTICILLISCYGQPDTNTIPYNGLTSIGEFAKAMAQIKGNGTILIQSNDYLISQDRPDKVDVSERLGRPNAIKFYETNNQPIDIFNKDQNFKVSLYGKTLKYAILNQPIKPFYVPNLLNVQFDKSELCDGLNITWNKDGTNYKGVVILITYKPTNQMYVIAKDNMDFITHGFVTTDNGSYTITKSDLARLPNKSQVTVNVLRSNYIVNDSDKPSLLAFTTIAHDFIVKK